MSSCCQPAGSCVARPNATLSKIERELCLVRQNQAITFDAINLIQNELGALLGASDPTMFDLTGGQMVPSVATTGEGRATARLITSGGPHGVLEIRGNFWNVVGAPTSATVHYGLEGEAASDDTRFELTLKTNPDQSELGRYYGQFTGDWIITEFDLDDLRTNRFSIILKTATETDGEIRGQIQMTDPPPGFFPLAGCP